MLSAPGPAAQPWTALRSRCCRGLACGTVSCSQEPSSEDRCNCKLMRTAESPACARSRDGGTSQLLCSCDACKNSVSMARERGQGSHMHVTLVQCACHNEHHIVNHVTVGAVVQEFGQGLISLQPWQLSVGPMLAHMPDANGCSHPLPPLASGWCIEKCAMLQCYHDAQLYTSLITAHSLMSSNKTTRAAYIDPQLVPIVHQLLSAPVHYCGCVQR